jgi:hypothetical protein
MTEVTPLRQQYLDLKAQYPDHILFFRLGDFYETFDEDAKTTAEVLDLVLTGRPVSRNVRVPMAGFPYHALERNVERMVKAGYRVAVAEQVSKPDGRTLVEREVTQAIEPAAPKSLFDHLADLSDPVEPESFSDSFAGQTLLQLGAQEPPQDSMIFNRRQADGTFRPLGEFFDRKAEAEPDPDAYYARLELEHHANLDAAEDERDVQQFFNENGFEPAPLVAPVVPEAALDVVKVASHDLKVGFRVHKTTDTDEQRSGGYIVTFDEDRLPYVQLDDWTIERWRKWEVAVDYIPEDKASIIAALQAEVTRLTAENTQLRNGLQTIVASERAVAWMNVTQMKMMAMDALEGEGAGDRWLKAQEEASRAAAESALADEA